MPVLSTALHCARPRQPLPLGDHIANRLSCEDLVYSLKQRKADAGRCIVTVVVAPNRPLLTWHCSNRPRSKRRPAAIRLLHPINMPQHRTTINDLSDLLLLVLQQPVLQQQRSVLRFGKVELVCR